MTYFTGNNQQKAKMNKDPAAYTLPKVTKGMPVDMYLFINQEQYVPQGRYDMSDLVWSEVGCVCVCVLKRERERQTSVVASSCSLPLPFVSARTGVPARS